MLKKLKIIVKSAGQIPFLNARGPINSPIWVKETVYDRLKRIGIDVKVVDEKTVESIRERMEANSVEEEEVVVVEPTNEEIDEQPVEELVEDEETTSEETEEVVEQEEEVIETPEEEQEEPVEELVEDEETVEITVYTEKEIEEMTNSEKREVLDERGVEYKYNAISDDLEELVLESQLEYME